jgi:hypothetical protein
MYRTIKISFLKHIYIQKFTRVYTFSIQNDMKEGNALLYLLFNFATEYAIRKAQKNQG